MLKKLPFLTTATLLTPQPPKSIDELNAKYNSISHTIHSLHDYFKITTTVGPTIATELNGKITLNEQPGLYRCAELRDVDEYGNTPMHVLALNARFDIIKLVFTYFQTTLNAKNKAIFFEKNQKNNDGLTAYDIARQRATTSQEQTIALQFFKFSVSDKLPITIFGKELPPSRPLRELMDCTATTIAASNRTIIIPGLDMSLPTLNESEQTLTARLKSRKVKTFSSFNSDLNGFSHQSIFGITQLKNAIGIDGEIQTVKQLTDRLATMARLSNDAKSGLKELFAPISRLAVAEQEAIWTPSFLTKSIQTIRDQLQAFTAVLPATFPIILAENGSHSIQFGHYSLILLYSRLLE